MHRRNLHFSTISRVVNASKIQIVESTSKYNQTRKKSHCESLNYSENFGDLINSYDHATDKTLDLNTPMAFPQVETKYFRRLNRFRSLDNWKSTSNCILFTVLILSMLAGIYFEYKLGK